MHKRAIIVVLTIQGAVAVAQQSTNPIIKDSPSQGKSLPQTQGTGDTKGPSQKAVPPDSGTPQSSESEQSKRNTPAIAAAKAGTSAERTRAIDMLGESRSRDAVPELSEILAENPDSRLREHSAASLGYIGSPSSVPALVEALTKDSAASVSASAAEALGRIGGSQADAALLRESNAARPVDVRSAAVRALGSFKTDESARALVAYTRDPVPEIRRAAVDGLVRQQSPSAAGAIVPLLRDRNPDVAQEAAWGLGELREQTAINPLSERLGTKGPIAVRRSSASALGRIGDPRSVSLLSHVALDPTDDISVRAASIQALGRLGNRDAGMTFQRVLKEQHSILRTLAAFYSCQLRIADSVGTMTELLPAVDAEEKKSLLSAIGFWPEPFVNQLTSLVIDRSEDGETRALALAALHELSSDERRSLAEKLALALRADDQVDIQIAIIRFLREVPAPGAQSALTRFSAGQNLDIRVRAALEEALKESK